MSGILALWNLDGQPIDPRLLQRLNDMMAHRGPDGDGIWMAGAAGLGHRALHTTPESPFEQQPLQDASGHLCLTFDGRLDNRIEIKADLERNGLSPRLDTDAELIILAYRCWGENCPQYLIGDFAFAVWDDRHRRIFCARDHVGVRPIYYYAGPRFFLCSSELRTILEHPAVPREPNEGMVGEYLASSITSQTETLYRDIYRLPPAHSLTISASGIQVRRYWDIDLLQEIHYRTDDVYAEHFTQVFKEAVRCRLRSLGSVGAELSGGLDSSSVVGMAAELIRSGNVPACGFESFSLTFPGQECDESRYIQDVIRKWSVKATLVTPEKGHAQNVLRQVREHLDFPEYPNYFMFHSLMHAQRSRGMRVSLTGIGGDDWLGGQDSPYADLLRRGQWLALLREIREGLRADDLPGILKRMVAPLLPDSIHRAYAWTKNRAELPSWIDAGFARRIHLLERLRARPESRPSSSYVRWNRFLHYRSGEQAHSNEIAERASSRLGLESRHPFHDRRVMEFALAMPNRQLQRGEQGKWVLRRAMRGLLPESVQQRLNKGEFSQSYVEAFDSLGGATFLPGQAIGMWVNGEATQRLYDRMQHLYSRNDPGYKSLTLPLWMILGINTWVATVFETPSCELEGDLIISI